LSIQIAVIPVAGLGTRLLPATKSQPKEMLPVAKKPVVQYVVEEMERNGIKQILLVTGRSKTSIENHFDFDHELTRHLREAGKEEFLPELEYERMRLQFFFTRQRRQKGLGDAIQCGQHFTGKHPFVVALGDSILGLTGSSQAVRRMVEVYETEGADCVIATEEVAPESVSSYGIVRPEGDGEVYKILDLVEKPAPAEAPSRLAIAARYVFSPEIYRAISDTLPGKNGELQLTDSIRLFVKEGKKVLGLRLPADEHRYDIGGFRSYFETFVDFALQDPDLGSDFETYLRKKLSGDC
jgi:UTP--glucose-1-phosphate uridylyltransferase